MQQGGGLQGGARGARGGGAAGGPRTDEDEALLGLGLALEAALHLREKGRDRHLAQVGGHHGPLLADGGGSPPGCEWLFWWWRRRKGGVGAAWGMGQAPALDSREV